MRNAGLTPCVLLLMLALAGDGCAPGRAITVDLSLERRCVSGEMLGFPLLVVTNRAHKPLWIRGLDPLRIHSGLTYSVRNSATGEEELSSVPFGGAWGVSGEFAEADCLLLAPGSSVGLCLDLALRPSPLFDRVVHLTKTFTTWPNAFEGPKHATEHGIVEDFVFRRHVPLWWPEDPSQRELPRPAPPPSGS